MWPKSLGKWGESKAKEFLSKRDVFIINQNVYTKYGEIDLVGLKDDTIIFFEIKTRKSDLFGYPEVAVDMKKQERLIAAAQAFIAESEITNQSWRIDVISISIYPEGQVEIEWFENAISS